MLDFLSQMINNKNTIATNTTPTVAISSYTHFKGHNQAKHDEFIKNTNPIHNNNNISFTGRFRIPVSEVSKYNKKYIESLNTISKEDIVNDLASTYASGLRDILNKYTPDEREYTAKKEFYGDYMHELFGSFIQRQQLHLVTLPETATKEDAVSPMKQIVEHVNGVMKRYKFFIDNKLDDTKTNIPVNKVWGLVKNSISQKIKSKNIKLNINNEDLINNSKLSTNHGYKNYTIMANILENATKYSPENSEINASFKVKNNNIHFIVKDKGIGIPPEDQEKVLTTGERGSNVGNIKGTGHGLFRVFKILEENNMPALKITSPLYPDNEIYKGTEIDAPILHCEVK